MPTADPNADQAARFVEDRIDDAEGILARYVYNRDAPDAATEITQLFTDLQAVTDEDWTVTIDTDIVIPSQPSFGDIPTTPTAPTITTSGLSFPSLDPLTDVTSTARYTALSTALRTLVGNLEQVLSDETRDELYDWQQRKLELDLADKIGLVENKWAARGYSMPPGMASGEVMRLMREYRQSIEDALDKISAAQMELALANKKDFLMVALQFEDLNLKTLQTVNQQRIDSYTAQLTGHLEEMESLIKQYSGQVSAYGALVDAKGKKVTAEADVFKAVVSAYVEEAKMRIDEARAQLEGKMGKWGFRQEAVKAAATIAAQIGASALNMISTSIGYRYSGTETLSYSRSDKTRDGQISYNYSGTI